MHFFLRIMQFILTSYEFMWFVLGGITFLSIYIINRKLKESGNSTKLISTLVVLTVFLVVFTILWMVESIFENEMKAAMLGVTIFGALSVIFGIITYRLVLKKKDSKIIKTSKKEE